MRDLIVIGAGSAGLSAATLAARFGAAVTLIEADRIGGDCTWTGCVPSKTLIHAAGVAHRMRRADVLGLPPVDVKVDLRAVMDRVRAAIDAVYRFESPAALAELGIEVITGAAHFKSPWELDVDGQSLRARRFVIATGARPMIPPIRGLADTPYLTYETVFDLGALPTRLLVLGAGPVGLELGQAFQRLGAQVTVFDQADRILSVADAEASAVVSERLTGEGLVLRLGVSVERVTAHGDSVTVTAGGTDHVGEALLVAAGRHAFVDRLGPEQAGVATSERGILVDTRLRTSQRHIYAAGDVTGAVQFTHYAGWQGAIAARNALLPGWMGGIPARVPWAVFTDPEVAHVGLSDDDARRRLHGVRVQRWSLTRIDRAHTIGDAAGFIKLVARRDGRLLGATIVAAQASELVNELALALDRRLTLDDLARTMHVYPTYGLGFQQAAGAATLDQLTHGWRGHLLTALARRWTRWTSRPGP